MAKVELSGVVDKVLSKGVLKVIEKRVSRDGREFRTWFTVFPVAHSDVRQGDAVSVKGFVHAECGGMMLQDDHPVLDERDGQPKRWANLLVDQATVSVVGEPSNGRAPASSGESWATGTYDAETPF